MPEGRGNRPSGTLRHRPRYRRCPIKALNHWLGFTVAGIASLLLALMTVIIFLQVLFRYFLMQPLHWTEETARFLFIWVALLGAAVAFKDRTHFAITMFTNGLPAPVRSAVQPVVALGTTFLLGVMIKEGWYLVELNQIQESPAIGVPMSVPYAAIPVGGALAIVFLWLDLLLHRRTGWTVPQAEEAAGGSQGLQQGAG
ncbi:MAG: TRAP transporter small permease [Chloroflexota bacterium]